MSPTDPAATGNQNGAAHNGGVEHASAGARFAVASWLTRGRLNAILLAVAAFVLIVLLLAVFGPRWWNGEGGTYAPKSVVTSGTITPRSSLFGDVLTAEARVIVDPRLYVPASAELASSFRPYSVRSRSRRISRGVGQASVIDFDYSIQCLSEPCLAFMSQKTRSGGTLTKAPVFPDARLTVRTPDGAVVAVRIPWPPIVVHSRLSAAQIALATPSLDSKVVLPAVSWRISPNELGAFALSLAVLFLLAATWLLASIALGDSRLLIRRLRIPSHLTPVDRALLLAEHASARGELEEERKALQRLAVELRIAGRDDLAGRAGRIAWSAEAPSPAVVGALASAVRAGDD